MFEFPYWHYQKLFKCEMRNRTRVRNSKGILQRLGDVLNSPKALYKSAKVINTAVVVTLEQKNGNPLLVPIHPDKQVGRYRVNVISSIYSKDNWNEVEPQWVEKGLLLWKRNIP